MIEKENESATDLILDFFKERKFIDNGHYVEDFEEDYSENFENFEDEREIEIFEQAKEEKKYYKWPGYKKLA